MKNLGNIYNELGIELENLKMFKNRHCLLAGRQLPGHKGATGCDVQDCCQHDQRQDTGGDSQDV